jgi:hypothetical protein
MVKTAAAAMIKKNAKLSLIRFIREVPSRLLPEVTI